VIGVEHDSPAPGFELEETRDDARQQERSDTAVDELQVPACSPMSEVLERELKWDVDEHFALPRIDDIVPGAAVQRSTVELQSAYYDTEDGDLQTHGVLLRRRDGDDDTGWQLKVPDAEGCVEIRTGLSEAPPSPRRLTERLVEAGATPSLFPSKFARVSGVTRPGLAGRTEAGKAVAAYLSAQIDNIFGGDLALRRGSDPIHDTRVAIRRLHSTLRVFGKLVEPSVGHVDDELKCFAGLLGEVRDCQVQRRHFREAPAQLPTELVLGPVANTINTDLQSDQLRARTVVTEAMGSHRYLDLLATLQRWRTDPPLTAPPSLAAVKKPANRAERKADRRLAQAGRGGRRCAAAPCSQGRQTRPIRRRTAQARREVCEGNGQALQADSDGARRPSGQRRRIGDNPQARTHRRHHPGRERLHLRPAVRPRAAGRRDRAQAGPGTDRLARHPFIGQRRHPVGRGSGVLGRTLDDHQFVDAEASERADVVDARIAKRHGQPQVGAVASAVRA
jgi:CHAD domain-containing protein